MTKKSFFRERSAEQIQRMNLSVTSTTRGLAGKIRNLDSQEGIIIRTPIIPGRFYQFVESWEDASRKCYKHGDLVTLSQPRTQGAAFECREIPLAIRARDFSELNEMREQEINYVGYRFKPVQGNDGRWRVVPFVWAMEGARLFAYAENVAGEIKVEPYADAKKVQFEGADIVCSVPSRTKKKGRYLVRFKHVPVEGSTQRRAVCWSLCTEHLRQAPEHAEYNIKYNYGDDAEGSDVFTFYPHDIAAYIAVIKHYNEKHNLTPIEMSPIALPSRKMADFYTRLGNNVLIYDPTLSSNDNKDKLRKLHLAEKSILLARAIGVFGHDATMFWDPERDGRLRDYNWGVDEK